VLILKSNKAHDRSRAILLVRRDGPLPPGNRKFNMFRSEEEKINIVIGEAILTLLEDSGVFSTHTLSTQLTKMLNVEIDAVRCEIIREAIRQTSKLLAIALCSGNSYADTKGGLARISCRQSTRHW